MDVRKKKDEEVLAISLTNPSAFSELVDRYGGAFLRKATGVVRDRDVAEDIVQETFTKIYLAAPRFQKIPGASFKSWAYRILMNTAISYYRKRSREYERVVPIDSEHYESLGTEDARFKQYESSDLVASLLTKLPKTLARVLTLRFLQGKTYEEIANIEGASAGAIKTRVYRAKRELKKFSVL